MRLDEWNEKLFVLFLICSTGSEATKTNKYRIDKFQQANTARVALDLRGPTLLNTQFLGHIARCMGLQSIKKSVAINDVLLEPQITCHPMQSLQHLSDPRYMALPLPFGDTYRSPHHKNAPRTCIYIPRRYSGCS